MNLTTFSLIWMGIGILVFFYLLFFKAAPYGRHIQKGWGPEISNKIGWMLMEIPALVLFLYFFFSKGVYFNQVVLVFVLLWTVHYFNRAFIFPLRIRTAGKKMPLTIVLSAIFFNSINTYLIAIFLAENPGNYSMEWLRSWQFISGFCLFLTGFFINQYSDYLLINLRTSRSETNYKIPHGFLFRWVSCPNLLGEIIEWAGFALMTWCLPSLSFLVWTMANLIPRAVAHHQWYKHKFENYPKERKAIFPFLG